MKLTFAETATILESLRSFKKSFESMKETMKETEDGERRWIFIEEELEDDDKLEYQRMKKLISKIENTEF